jgi:hypothetical protein
VIAKRKANVEKVKKKLEKDAKIALEKTKKDAARSLKKRERQSSMTLIEGASSGGQDTVPLASIPSPIGGSQKRDATFIGPLALRLL